MNICRKIFYIYNINLKNKYTDTVGNNIYLGLIIIQVFYMFVTLTKRIRQIITHIKHYFRD